MTTHRQEQYLASDLLSITYFVSILHLVFSMVLPVIKHIMLSHNILHFCITSLYRTMLHEHYTVPCCMSKHIRLDSLSSLTIHYTVPCRLCMLTFLDLWSSISIQASTLASPVIYNYPSHYSLGLFYDNLY